MQAHSKDYKTQELMNRLNAVTKEYDMKINGSM